MAKIAEKVHLPYDSHLDWAGEINQLNEAEDRLKMILPITLLLIAFLVYSATKSWLDSLIVFFNIPVATAGGVIALLVTGIHFSVSAAMGFIVPGIALVLLNWSCAWLMLGRTREAPSTVRSAAVASLMANVGLLVIAAAHFAVVEAQRQEGIRHACSTSVTFVVIVFAIASLALSTLTLAVLRAHHRELGWNGVKTEG